MGRTKHTKMMEISEKLIVAVTTSASSPRGKVSAVKKRYVKAISRMAKWLEFSDSIHLYDILRLEFLTRVQETYPIDSTAYMAATEIGGSDLIAHTTIMAIIRNEKSKLDDLRYEIGSREALVATAYIRTKQIRARVRNAVGRMSASYLAHFMAAEIEYSDDLCSNWWNECFACDFEVQAIQTDYTTTNDKQTHKQYIVALLEANKYVVFAEILTGRPKSERRLHINLTALCDAGIVYQIGNLIDNRQQPYRLSIAYLLNKSKEDMKKLAQEKKERRYYSGLSKDKTTGAKTVYKRKEYVPAKGDLANYADDGEVGDEWVEEREEQTISDHMVEFGKALVDERGA